jgi:hypothetical protein
MSGGSVEGASKGDPGQLDEALFIFYVLGRRLAGSDEQQQERQSEHVVFHVPYLPEGANTAHPKSSRKGNKTERQM